MLDDVRYRSFNSMALDDQHTHHQIQTCPRICDSYSAALALICVCACETRLQISNTSYCKEGYHKRWHCSSCTGKTCSSHVGQVPSDLKERSCLSMQLLHSVKAAPLKPVAGFSHCHDFAKRQTNACPHLSHLEYLMLSMMVTRSLLLFCCSSCLSLQQQQGCVVNHLRAQSGRTCPQDTLR